jgi:hypothetical protein
MTTILVADNGACFSVSRDISPRFADDKAEYRLSCSSDTLSVIVGYYLRENFITEVDVIEMYQVAKEYKFHAILNIAFDLMVKSYSMMDIIDKTYVIKEMILVRDRRLLEVIEPWLMRINTFEVNAIVIDILEIVISDIGRFSPIPLQMTMFAKNQAYWGYLRKIAVLMAMQGQCLFIKLLKSIPGNHKLDVHALLSYAETTMKLRSWGFMNSAQKRELRDYIRHTIKWKSINLPSSAVISSPPKMNKKKRHVPRPQAKAIPFKIFEDYSYLFDPMTDPSSPSN